MQRHRGGEGQLSLGMEDRPVKLEHGISEYELGCDRRSFVKVLDLFLEALGGW